MIAKKESFSSSRELRIYFNEQFEVWKERTSGNLKLLASLCGVSPSYLSQVSRYGRVPGRPVLVLLAFNFRLSDPQKLFELANIKEDWPYEKRIGLFQDTRGEDSFVTVKVDLPGLSESIRSIIKHEMKPVAGSDLLARGPIRIGVNSMQPWMLESQDNIAEHGVFQDLCLQLGVSFQQQVVFKQIPFAQYQKRLVSSDIDLYGPVMSIPTNSSGIVFSRPLLRTSVVAVARQRDTPELAKLPNPKRIEDLRTSDHKIAVLKGALPQLILATKLKIPPERLILCDSDEEARDRIILKGIQNPAHLFICNSLFAESIQRDHPKYTKALFEEGSGAIDMEDVTFAIKPEWQSVAPLINQALDFLLARAGFASRISELFTEKTSKLLTFVA